MIPTELPFVFTDRLEQAGFAYMVVGAYATMSYGVHRTTSDLDLVIDLKPGLVMRFLGTFPELDFYVPPAETLLEESRRAERGHFNLIHQATQERADCYLPGTDPLQHWALRNCRSIEFESGTFRVAPPELVILKKLEFFREGGSEKHVYDIRAICQILTLDRELLEREAAQRGLLEYWRQCAPPTAH